MGNLRVIIEIELEKQRIGDVGHEVSLIISDVISNFIVSVSPDEELRQADAIFAYGFGFGPRKDGQPFDAGKEVRYDSDNSGEFFPGKTNDGLADVIIKMRDKGINLPIFAQLEIADSLAIDHSLTLPETNIANPKEWAGGTYGFAKMFFKNVEENCDSAIVVAHPHHMKRAMTTTLDAAAESGKKDFRVYSPNVFDVRYDPNSVQAWTRSAEAFIPYELANRISFRLGNFSKQASE